MAQPLPLCPVTIPSFVVDEGDRLTDATTKSSMRKPVLSVVQDICDRDAYNKFAGGMTINQFINCTLVQASNISIKGQLPVNCSSTELEALIDAVKNEILTAYAAWNTP